MIADLQGAARSLGRQLIVENARTDSDLETAFASFSRQHVGAVLISTGTFFARRTEQLAALAAHHALPAIFPYREYVLTGGLMSYGSVINLKTAKALGLTIPETLLATADEVIQ